MRENASSHGFSHQPPLNLPAATYSPWERKMVISRHCLLWAVGALTVLAGAAACRAQALDLDALYARAAEEGEVSAYLQGPPQVYADFVRQFEAAYPKVKVRITSGRYDLMPKIDA